MRLLRLVLLFFILIPLLGNGQTTLLPKQVENKGLGIIYKSEWAFDARIHTNGMALALNFGDIKTYYKTRYYQFEIGYIKDSRERRQNNNFSLNLNQTSKSYAYGKRNSLFVLRAGFGEKRYLSEKEKKRGLAVGWNYEVGPSLALLKPYYLELIYPLEGDPTGGMIELRSEKYKEENAEVFLDENRIFGSTGFFNGFGELSVVPGVQAKAGLHFALGAFDKYVKAFEVGVMGDFFIKKIPVMVETRDISNKPYFINFYINIHLGKRSYK